MSHQTNSLSTLSLSSLFFLKKKKGRENYIYLWMLLENEFSDFDFFFIKVAFRIFYGFKNWYCRRTEKLTGYRFYDIIGVEPFIELMMS